MNENRPGIEEPTVSAGMFLWTAERHELETEEDLLATRFG